MSLVDPVEDDLMQQVLDYPNVSHVVSGVEV